MNDSFEEELPSESALWDRAALECLGSQLKRSKSELMKQEADEPAFNPLKVRNLIRDVIKHGETPKRISLGQLEAASFRHFVSRGFGEESGCQLQLRQHYFMGLEIIEVPCATKLEIVSEEEKPGQTSFVAA